MVAGVGPGAEDDGGQGEQGERLLGSVIGLDVCQFSVSAVPPSVRVARTLVRDWLIAAGWPLDRVDDVVLAVSEVVSNAIEHAYPATGQPLAELRTVAVHAAVESDPGHAVTSATAPSVDRHPGMGRRVQIEITDHGRWRPPDVDLGHVLRDRGRGLPLLRMLLDQVLIETDVDGVDAGGTRITLITSAGIQGTR